MSVGQFAEIGTMAILGFCLKRLGWRTIMILGILGHTARFGIFAMVPIPSSTSTWIWGRRLCRQRLARGSAMHSSSPRSTSSWMSFFPRTPRSMPPRDAVQFHDSRAWASSWVISLWPFLKDVFTTTTDGAHLFGRLSRPVSWSRRGAALAAAVFLFLVLPGRRRVLGSAGDGCSGDVTRHPELATGERRGQATSN